MNISESDLLEKWLSDDSFVSWAKNTNEGHTHKWNLYFDQHPEQLELAELGKFALLNLGKTQKLDQARSQIALERLKGSLAEKAILPKKEVKVFPLFKRWQVAAAVLLLIGLSFWGYHQNSDTINQVIIATNFGETQEIILADQSKVILNANSTLSYSKKQPRKVWLKGEAYFNVSKQPTTGENFQVFTDDLTVKVLGTVFNVKNRQSQTKVFLEEGKVVLEMDKQVGGEIEMASGELISYSKNQQKIIENRMADALENTSWKNGIIRFNEKPLNEVLDEVSAIYDVTFKVENETVINQLYSGGIPTQNKEIMLSALKEVFRVEITLEDNIYSISPIE